MAQDHIFGPVGCGSGGSRESGQGQQREKEKERVRLLHYDSVDSIMPSDHKPVAAFFRLQSVRVDVNRERAAYEKFAAMLVPFKGRTGAGITGTRMRLHFYFSFLLYALFLQPSEYLQFNDIFSF